MKIMIMAFIAFIFFACQFNAAASSNLLLSKPRTIANYDGPALAGLAVGISCELDPSFLQLASGYGCWYANFKKNCQFSSANENLLEIA